MHWYVTAVHILTTDLYTGQCSKPSLILGTCVSTEIRIQNEWSHGPIYRELGQAYAEVKGVQTSPQPHIPIIKNSIETKDKAISYFFTKELSHST